jgi:CheY-like chemotaxis protein
MDPRFIDGGVRTRVLIADDERIIADTLGLILNQNGFEAATVYSGQKAVEAAAAFRPQVFLADVVMPGMSGIEAAIQICMLIPECRVLLLSGQAATTDLLRDARVRGHDFEILLKPVHPTQLIDRLRGDQSLRGWARD